LTKRSLFTNPQNLDGMPLNLLGRLTRGSFNCGGRIEELVVGNKIVGVEDWAFTKDPQNLEFS